MTVTMSISKYRILTELYYFSKKIFLMKKKLIRRNLETSKGKEMKLDVMANASTVIVPFRNILFQIEVTRVCVCVLKIFYII